MDSSGFLEKKKGRMEANPFSPLINIIGPLFHGEHLGSWAIGQRSFHGEHLESMNGGSDLSLRLEKDTLPPV